MNLFLISTIIVKWECFPSVTDESYILSLCARCIYEIYRAAARKELLLYISHSSSIDMKDGSLSCAGILNARHRVKPPNTWQTTAANIYGVRVAAMKNITARTLLKGYLNVSNVKMLVLFKIRH